MPRVDFLISNDRHHKAMSWPVAERLTRDGSCVVRVLSLCELRGLPTPDAAKAPEHVEVCRVVPWRLRRSPSAGAASLPGALTGARTAARAIIWRLLLAPRLEALLRDAPDLVVLPNDAAFPYDRIARLLDARRVPFLLLQEGIRFPLEGQAAEPVYGAAGAAAVAAWGEAAADYFRAAGVPADRIHLTGSPRYDRSVHATGGDHGERSLGLPGRTLLLASNPIDDQGFCSHREKISLIGRFLAGIEPLFADPDFHLAVKLHSRERPEEIRSILARSPGERVSIHTDVALEDLFRSATAVVVLASTVGLEALLHDLPLAVLEIPGHGFQYDYVESGAAVGLRWNAPMAGQVEGLFEPSAERLERVEAYMQRQFASRDEATSRVEKLIRRLLAESR